MPNRLAQETSPYLLQHADNPVDWYPWGEEAFAKAKAEDKPVLLSVGYAACHWCHVMAHESFEDEETAALMNDLFVNIKVDREERPDVDQIYMSAVVAMTGQGGWPMTVAMTPDGKPFFGGTYYPKTARYGMPSFEQVLVNLRQAWDNQRDKVDESAEGIANHISRGLVLTGQEGVLDKGLLNTAVQQMGARFDKQWGGFSDAPKFPQPMNLEFMLRAAVGTADPNVLHMLTHTLDKMARGGMYDQIGGGFARYSVDAKWLVPHFEKMLYDNAQLARVYLHAWQVTGNPQFKRITEETLDYILREMTHEDGGFYSSLDADSEGEEGKFYVWTLDEIRQVLGEDAELVALYYDISAQGNWEGKNIPNMPRTHTEVSQQTELDEDQLRQKIEAARGKLYAYRAQRVWPGRDDKVLTAWNGLMMAAFAEAGRVLHNEKYTAAAVKNADFLYNTMRTTNGRLLRTWKAGSQAKYNGYLEDYAFLADGLIALYQTTFDERWFAWAHELTELMVTHFLDENGGFYDTSDDHEALIFRPKDVQDNAVPSGNAMAVLVLLQMSLYTGHGRYYDIAEQAISSMYGAMAQYPNGFGQWLNAATLILNQPQEIAIVGEPQTAETQTLIQTVFDGYRPYQVVAVGTDGDIIELLADRPQVDGRATAYVCENFACQLPTTDSAVLREQLNR